MLGSSLALAMGIVFLAAVRASGQPQAFGVAVFVGIVLVAVACAMHVGAIVDRLDPIAPPFRVAARWIAWVVVAGGTAWLIGRAPGDEVLLGLLIAPTALGIAGMVVAHDDPWPAVAFLALAGLLIVVVGPVWLERQGGW